MAEATASNEQLLSTLEELAILLRDAQKEYTHAAEDLKDTDLLSFRLEVLSRERAEGADALDEMIQHLDGCPPSKEGSTSGALHRRWMDVRGAASGGARAPVLQELHRFEAYLEACYDKAVGEGLRDISVPDDIAQTIRWQQDSVRQARERSRAMLEEIGVRPAAPGGTVSLVAGAVPNSLAERPVAVTTLAFGLGLVVGLLLMMPMRPATGGGKAGQGGI